jgi:hypothetical protein
MVRPAPAAELIQAEAYRLATNQALPRGAWILAGSMVIEGDSGDDLFLLAQERMRWKHEIPSGRIVLAGAMSNDVWALGRDITVSGTIADHARFLAPQGSILVQGSIGNEAQLWGGTIFVQSNAALARGGALYGDEVVVQGACGGPLSIQARSATLAGRFEGDVTVAADEIALLAGTVIAGTLTYMSPRDLTPGEGVSVAGGLVRMPAPEPSPWDGLLLQLWLYAGSVLTGGLFWKIFPDAFNRAGDLVSVSSWKCLLAGLLTASLLITGTLVATVSLVGLPLAAALAAAGGLLGYLAKVAVALAAGGWLLRRTLGRPRPGLTGLTLGLALLYVGTNLPGPLGALVWLGVTVLGMGGLMLALLARTPWARPFGLAAPEAGGGPPPLPGGMTDR